MANQIIIMFGVGIPLAIALYFFYTKLYKNMQAARLANKHKEKISTILEQLKEYPEDHAKRDDKLREAREKLIIDSDIPMFVWDYIMGGIKNGNTKKKTTKTKDTERSSKIRGYFRRERGSSRGVYSGSTKGEGNLREGHGNVPTKHKWLLSSPKTKDPGDDSEQPRSEQQKLKRSWDRFRTDRPGNR